MPKSLENERGTQMLNIFRATYLSWGKILFKIRLMFTPNLCAILVENLLKYSIQDHDNSYTSHHFSLHGRFELNKLTSLPMCDFIAQLVEQRTGNAEVTGSNPVEALIFFRLLRSNCLNWKIYCDDHSSLSEIVLPW